MLRACLYYFGLIEFGSINLVATVIRYADFGHGQLGYSFFLLVLVLVFVFFFVYINTNGASFYIKCPESESSC